MKGFEKVRALVGGKIVTTDIAFDEHVRLLGKAGQLEKIELPSNAIVLPGFIDEHIHGAGGHDAMDGSTAALKGMAHTLAAEGTTGFLATTMTQSEENILHALNAVKEYRAGKNGGARLLGVHLEGPFIAEAHKGAQPKEYIAAPDVALFRRYNEASGNCIRIVTLAPEIEGAETLISHLKDSGIVASIGHTSAKFADIARAVERGATHVTHTFNAQSALHHREIGTVGSALLMDGLTCELIADTVHVCVPAMQLLVKSKGERVILITDAIRAKGLGDGESELGGQKVFVKDGQARLADGTLAGSVLRMNVAIKNMVQKVGVPLPVAVKFATENPARALGVFEETGSIEVGKRADFAVLDDDFNVLLTFCGGEIVYRAEAM